ncbi:MAG: tRNA nucleotidyltransferase [Zetaproteobacteria bacterium CG_4_9_14_3_um_filter_49_83]|nr:MAG: tRNA nucleotidyltransferase [Zetaproteobacteria bacterium CG1_02_49_23]PIQ32300.1 MAG: tRNA nucleotidyltransferase [Zetaproteobacteria bacterium CG17_big_fil_post_rev_8_21_14_2_50_50_13]PIV30061.1 MAG: tRNA nucleotidyltransferase [Zetaproteobacteria bacterium CG02_land_8_20_14_3_00_50_9]PIY56986.1 MAG: tRNA nucleotidyltransferase [Zetaproteobacteria bacterium CG_4_10_14_0_8_um_filter_49_80]PJA34653.1 MAG: tRNA nucleotidyltransferase [Zetaproteobacteria bacterium CG_4_9_14_3_um_filter_49
MITQPWHTDLPPLVLSLCQHIRQQGGTAWLVGGCVRDIVMQKQPQDFDVEVFGLSQDDILLLCHALGHCEAVGKQFGVFKLFARQLCIDIALPRRELKTASGHRGFDVETDPNLPPEIASSRRDFSINAMMLNPLTRELLDFHHGLQDLKQRILRHVSPAFIEDPLRVLRAMQFAARFNCTLADETAQLCRTLLAEADSLPPSRIWQEWQKWSHADHPSKGLLVLQQTGWLSLYPELTALIDCQQSPMWHPEGDVWVHTLQVCDQAASIASRELLNDKQREHLIFAGLCHDFGKPETTSIDEQGNIRSPNHGICGIQTTQTFLSRIQAPGILIKHTLPLVREHIAHVSGQPSARAVRRLAARLEPASIERWEMLVEADASGRYPAPASRPAKTWLEQAHTMSVQHEKSAPLLTGKLLLSLGEKPGIQMGNILHAAYQAQLDGDFHDQSEAIAWYKLHHAAPEALE